MKIIVIIVIAFVLVFPSLINAEFVFNSAYGQSYVGVLTFDPIPLTATIGDTINFSGGLHQTDGAPISGETIQIKDDVSWGTDVVLIKTTTDANGRFSTSWTVTERVTISNTSLSGNYEIYAILDKTGSLNDSRSNSYVLSISSTQSIQEPGDCIPSFLLSKFALDGYSKNVKSGDNITLSGTLLSRNDCIIPDTDVYLINFNVIIGTSPGEKLHELDTVLAKTKTDSNGKFSLTWKAEGLPNDLLPAIHLSEMHRNGNVASKVLTDITVELYSSSIVLDPIPKGVDIGDIVKFSGILTLENGNPEGKTVYIKDEDVLDDDDILATAIVDNTGHFFTTWVVEERDIDDRKTGAALLELIDPTLVGAQKLNEFLNTLERGTVEIYAVFEEDSVFERSSTCTTNYDTYGNKIYCINNVLTISGESTEEKIIAFLLEDESGNEDTTSNEQDLFSILARDKISDEDLTTLEDMLLGSTPIKQQKLNDQDMSLEEILTSLEKSNLLDDSFIQTNSNQEEYIEDISIPQTPPTEWQIEPKPTTVVTKTEVYSDKEYYIVNDVIAIKGQTPSKVAAVKVQIDDPNGNLVKLIQIPNNGLNDFSTSIQIEKLWFTVSGKYTINAWTSQAGPDKDSLTVIIEIPGSEFITKKVVPSWVKNNAEWWADGQIDDGSFTQGLEFLIKEKIINVKSASQDSGNSKEIPSWVKNNAEWWAQGLISEDDFLKGIEFLVKEGIIDV